MAKALVESTTLRCYWTEDDDGIWHSDCGQDWQFIGGGPEENSVRYCNWCGLPVRAVPWDDKDRD